MGELANTFAERAEERQRRASTCFIQDLDDEKERLNSRAAWQVRTRLKSKIKTRAKDFNKDDIDMHCRSTGIPLADRYKAIKANHMQQFTTIHNAQTALISSISESVLKLPLYRVLPPPPLHSHSRLL